MNVVNKSNDINKGDSGRTCVTLDPFTQSRSEKHCKEKQYNVFYFNKELNIFTVADPGFARRRGANPWFWSKILLFGKGFAENCMKMKEIGLRTHPSPDQPMLHYAKQKLFEGKVINCL